MIIYDKIIKVVKRLSEQLIKMQRNNMSELHNN